MDESDVHIEFDFFNRLSLNEVRPDAPVLLWWIDDVIVDPATTWCLEKWMIQKEAELSARA